MIVSIMQPTYLPWLGYFELMARADYFVLFDDVQFVRCTWHHRNRIKSPNGELFLAVPVKRKGSLYQNISEVLIDEKQVWGIKHLRSIQMNYARAPYFERYFDGLQAVYLQPLAKLCDLNLALIAYLKEQLGIPTPLVLSSTIPKREDRNGRIIDICRHFQADTFYNPEKVRELIDLAQFAEAGIQVKLQHYTHPEYPQLYGPFLPHMSVLDLLFNQGERALEVLLSGAR